MGKAAFLFGSGISRASQAPSVEEITGKVLREPMHESFISAQAFLRMVNAEIENHIGEREGRSTNYEDVFAAVYQIYQDLTGDITNPMVRHLEEKLRGQSLELQMQLPLNGWTDPFINLLHSSYQLIESVVWRELAPITVPEKLDVLTEVVASADNVDIFTLNHDLLIENLFRQSYIPFSDGFAEEDGSLTRFSWSWKPEDRVRLFKLHGSIDWFRFSFEKEDREYKQYTRVVGDHRHCKLASGKFARDVDRFPAILTGTTVKEQTYGIYLFGDIFAKFREYLSKHDSIIVCGYGWGDKGINHRLYQWLGDGIDHRITILHNNPEEKIENKKFWGFKWDQCRRRVEIFDKWLGDCSISDLVPYFDRR